MVLDAMIDWVITKVITSAITKVATMFNPAGAIIQAIIMVYNVGTWLAANLGKILDFIESVLNSVDRIASGDIGGAASFIEQALARMIPILIGFLASMIGLGGLGDKIKSFINKVQTAVGKAVDFVIDKVFNFAKKLIGKLIGKDGKKKSAADHAVIGKAAAEQMKKAPAKAEDLSALKKTKQADAVQVAEKYNQELEPAVRMKITVKDPPAGDSKIPFHIHIGPNDFDMDAAVEGTGNPPEVGTYGGLKKSSGPKNQEAHHVPPKGLMNWLVGQAKKAFGELTKKQKADPEFAWVKELSGVKSNVYDPGDPLAAISVHKETHIKTSGTGADTWRIHFGSETAKAVVKRLRGKKIAVKSGDTTYLLDFAFIYKSAKLSGADLAELREMESEAGESLAAQATAPAGAADRPVSTQFFKTELNTALEEAKAKWGTGIENFKNRLGAVGRGAAAQARAAAVSALENSKKDGTKDQRSTALGELAGTSKSTWEKVAGIIHLKLL
jgi:hypothetical protein